MIDSTVLFENQHGIGLITLNRPAARNSITPQLCIDLSAAIERAANDDGVRVVVLRGAGDHFCAGADLAQQPGERTMPLEEMLLLGGRAAMALYQMPKPTIALIRGSVAGGGLALALACDIRLADSSSVMSFAYSRIGVSGDFGCLYFLSRVIGHGAATEFALACPKLSAQQAVEWGVLRQVYPADELQEACENVSQQLVQMSSLALGKIKENLVAAQDLSPDDYLQLEAKNFAECRNSGEFLQVMQAYRDKLKNTTD